MTSICDMEVMLFALETSGHFQISFLVFNLLCFVFRQWQKSSSSGSNLNQTIDKHPKKTAYESTNILFNQIQLWNFVTIFFQQNLTISDINCR